MATALSSDPHAWLRPIYARLQAHPVFRQFAPSHQFEQLVQAVEGQQPSKAAHARVVGCSSARPTRSSRLDDRSDSPCRLARTVESGRLPSELREIVV